MEIDGHYEGSTLPPVSLYDHSHDHDHSDLHHHHHHHSHDGAPHVPTDLSVSSVADLSNAPFSTSNSASLQVPQPNRNKRSTPDFSASESECEAGPSKRRPAPLRTPSASPPPPSVGNACLSNLTPASTSARAAVGGPCRTLTRPWKDVYTERLTIERNWRKGRYEHKVLKGHADGVMCLQVMEGERWKTSCDAKGKHPAGQAGSGGVLITGSYDRTAKVWDLETGKEVMVRFSAQRF